MRLESIMHDCSSFSIGLKYVFSFPVGGTLATAYIDNPFTPDWVLGGIAGDASNRAYWQNEAQHELHMRSRYDAEYLYYRKKRYLNKMGYCCGRRQFNPEMPHDNLCTVHERIVNYAFKPQLNWGIMICTFIVAGIFSLVYASDFNNAGFWINVIAETDAISRDIHGASLNAQANGMPISEKMLHGLIFAFYGFIMLVFSNHTNHVGTFIRLCCIGTVILCVMFLTGFEINESIAKFFMPAHYEYN